MVRPLWGRFHLREFFYKHITPLGFVELKCSFRKVRIFMELNQIPKGLHVYRKRDVKEVRPRRGRIHLWKSFL